MLIENRAVVSDLVVAIRWFSKRGPQKIGEMIREIKYALVMELPGFLEAPLSRPSVQCSQFRLRLFTHPADVGETVQARARTRWCVHTCRKYMHAT